MAARTVVSVAGGLGNQLFTFAAAALIAKRSGTEVVIDVTRTAHSSCSADTIAALNFGCRLVNLFDGPMITSRADALLIRTTWKLGLLRPAWQPRLGLYMSDVPGFDAHAFGISEPIKLRGLYQDYRYPEFVWPNEEARRPTLHKPSNWYLEESVTAVAARPIMVHVRRGDFRFHTSFGLLSPEYYRSVIAEELALDPDRAVWIFSDDLDEASSLGIRGARYMRSPSGAAEDMLLMSHGSALVIANSTFSWWSAWMSGGKARVYLPSPWFKREPWATGFHVPGWKARPAEWL